MPIFTLTSEYTNVAALQRSITINGKVFPVNAVRRTGGAEIWLQAFLTSALDGGECLI